MAKPRRKHPGFHVIGESEPGRIWLGLLEDGLGQHITYTPTAFVDGRTHVFAVRGTLGEGEVRVHKGFAVDGCWMTDYEFRQRRWTVEGSGVLTHTLTAFRADPALGSSAPPDGLSKRAAKRWEDAQRAQVGDAFDTLEESFEPDDHVGDLADAVPVFRRFSCSMCDEAAAVVEHIPARHDSTNRHAGMLAQDITRPRVVVSFGDALRVWSERDGNEAAFAAAREALEDLDAARLARTNPEWVPFYCLRCERTYCAKHWTTTSPADESVLATCPQQHAHAESLWVLP